MWVERCVRQQVLHTDRLGSQVTSSVEPLRSAVVVAVAFGKLRTVGTATVTAIVTNSHRIAGTVAITAIVTDHHGIAVINTNSVGNNVINDIEPKKRRKANTIVNDRRRNRDLVIDHRTFHQLVSPKSWLSMDLLLTPLSTPLLLATRATIVTTTAAAVVVAARSATAAVTVAVKWVAAVAAAVAFT